MITEDERVRLINRVQTCRSMVKQAKIDLCFWSGELSLAVEGLACDRQFNFDDLLKGD